MRLLEASVARLEAAAATGHAASVAAAVPPEPLPESEPAAVAMPPRRRLPSLAGLEARVAQRWLVWGSGPWCSAWGPCSWPAGRWSRGSSARRCGAPGGAPRVRPLGLGERARRGQAAAGNDLVAPALAAGGLCALYGAALAAHLAYGLVEPGVAFLLLALASGLGAALGLRFGPLVGLLGSIGACVTPAFVQTQAPADWPLFLYLAAVAVGLVALARLSGQAAVAWVALAGAVAWEGVWLAGEALGRPQGASPAAPSLHLLVLGLAGTVALFPLRLDRASPGRGLAWAFRLTAVPAVLLLQPVLWASGFAVAPLLALAALALAAVTAAWLLDRERWLAALATVAWLLSAGAAWPVAPAPETGPPHPAILLQLAPEAVPLAAALALTGALGVRAGLGGGAWRGAPCRRYRAGLSAAGPLAALATAYWRLGQLAVSPGFAALALVLAGVLLLAAERTARRPELAAALGAYAHRGDRRAWPLGCAVSLRDAWLTVSLSLLLAATAWVGRRLDLPAVRRPTWVLAAVVLVRLAADVDLLPAPEAASALRVAYAYGVPLARLRAGRPLVTARAARSAGRLPGRRGAAALAAPARPARPHRRGARRRRGSPPWRRPGSAPAPWACWARPTRCCAGAGRTRRRASRATAGRRSPILGGAALLVGPLDALNPLEDRGARRPLAGPRPAAGRLRRPGALVPCRRARAPGGPAARVAAAAGHLLAFVWLTLEVRHWFQGPSLRGPTREAEWLAYSAAWLAWAALLLGLGVRLDRAAPAGRGARHRGGRDRQGLPVRPRRARRPLPGRLVPGAGPVPGRGGVALPPPRRPGAEPGRSSRSPG